MIGNFVRKVFGEEQIDFVMVLVYFGLELNKKILFFFGGSLGVQLINEVFVVNVDLMKKYFEVQLLW